MARKSRKHLADAPKVAAAFYIRSAFYIRLSVEDNNNRGNSLETQRMILEQYLEDKPDFQIVGVYTDNGVSGTTFQREGFQSMLGDIENGLIDCVLVKDLSRLGRNVIDTGYYIERYFPKYNVRFIAVNDCYDSADTESIHSGIMLPLKNMINEAYSKDISRKIKAQQHQCMSEGGFVGARSPYGYMKHPDDCHKLIIDTETAPVVAQIFEWAHGGDGLNTIVKKLNEGNILPPSHYKKQKGLISHENLLGEGKWQTRTVSKLLDDEVYTGDMVQGKTKSIDRRQIPVPREEWIIVRNTHEPIITHEMYDAVQRLREQVAKDNSNKTKAEYSPNIWKGKIFCGHCGRPLHRQKSTFIHSHAYYLHCITQSRMGKGACRVVSIPEKELAEVVLSYLSRQLNLALDDAIRIRKDTSAQSEEKSNITKEIAALRQDKDKSLYIARSLYENLVSGTITQDEYFSMKSDYETKSSAAEQRIAALEQELSELKAQEVQAEKIMLDAQELERNPNLTAELIDRLIERIELFEDKRVSITCRFSVSGLCEGAVS